MSLRKKIKRIFKRRYKQVDIVREITFVGKMDNAEYVYVVQQETNKGINNFCISAAKNDYEKIWYQLRNLKATEVYLYLKSRLLIEPFIENNLEEVLKKCKGKLPSINQIEYSMLME